MEFGKLVPQIFFDILTRFVPGAVLLCSWIVFLGQDDWRRLLDALLGATSTMTTPCPCRCLPYSSSPFSWATCSHRSRGGCSA